MNGELINFIVTQLRIYTNDNLVAYLLNSRDTWVKQDVLKGCSFLKDELENFNNIENSFEKDVYLKLTINNIYNNQIELDKWIVMGWGGITTHKHFDTLNESKEKRSFDRISSWSKLLSFENIEEDIIYDSRVIYSLNWLIYKYNKQNNAQEKYLFQPGGRGKKISLLPVNSIICFEHALSLDENKRGDKVYGDIYIKRNESYNYAKKLINLTNQLLFDNTNIDILSINIKANMYPFFTEMLLFELANKEIFDDIKKSIHINIEKEL